LIEGTRGWESFWEGVVPLFGASNGGERQKNREMGWALGVDGRRLKILHTTTNQKQAAATEGTMKGRRDEREARGKHDTIVFGRHYS
jgi:hypothetical protein